MEGGHPLAFNLISSAILHLKVTPRILHYRSQSLYTPTWALDPAKSLTQHYISLQDLNSCTESSSSINLALVHRPANLLASGALGRLLHAWEHCSPPDRCTCGFTCTPGECSLHGHTCWAAGLCTYYALAVLATIQTALVIAQRDRLPWFIIIVQTLDDVTWKSPVAFIVPLMLKLGCHLHYPIALRPLVTSMSML